MPQLTFTPPANLSEMNKRAKDRWHETMTEWFGSMVDMLENGSQSYGIAGLGRGRSQFFLPTSPPAGAVITEIPIVWPGFPRSLMTLYPRRRAFEAAEAPAYFGIPDAENPPGTMTAAVNAPPFLDDGGRRLAVSYRLQDEYLEWRVARSSSGRIRRITFTCEGPEYWDALAHFDRALLVKLYRRFVNRSVEYEDLCWPQDVFWAGKPFAQKGDYNPYNRWNTSDGIMHLSHPSNTLKAEIELAASSTVLRKGIGSKYLAESIRLTCAAALGDPNRSSDPQIAGSVNKLAQIGAKITLARPVGLYIDSLTPHCVTYVDGTPAPANWWRVVRGEPGVPGNPTHPSRILRAEYVIPSEEQRPLYVDGELLEFGGQIAAHVRMKLIAGFVPGDSAAPPQPCFTEASRWEENPDYLWPSPIGRPGFGFVRAFPNDGVGKRS